MPLHPEDHDKLERAIHRTLRTLPLRPAPRSLEQRVLAELARRAALPWWRQSFTHWPATARAAFLVVGIGVVKLALMASVWIMSGFDSGQFRSAFGRQFAWMESGLAVGHALAACIEIVLRNIPPLWFYGGVGFVVAMYVALFGLGAAAYKVIHAQR